MKYGGFMTFEQEKNKIVLEAEQLVGTKWSSWKRMLGDKVSVEFIDKKNCIYTSQPNKYTMTYSIAGGELYISNIIGSFELRGNVLFNNDLPVFEKVA